MAGDNTAFKLGQDQTGVEFEGKFLSFYAGTPTAGVSGYGKGALAVDSTNGKLYINTGTFAVASWDVVGTQS
tara:strand:- start:1722 stop:1937 length:216 start_codon:yes stop_codon:yes gene_type:complete